MYLTNKRVCLIGTSVQPSLFQAFRLWSASEKCSERKSGKERGETGEDGVRTPSSDRLEQASAAGQN